MVIALAFLVLALGLVRIGLRRHVGPGPTEELAKVRTAAFVLSLLATVGFVVVALVGL